MTESPLGILIAAGDISTCSKNRNLSCKKNNGDWSNDWHCYANRTAAIIHKIVKEAEAVRPKIPVRVLPLGDLAYIKGTAREFACFAKRWSGFNDILRPVPGNHEYLTRGAEPYYLHFASNQFVQQNGRQKGYFAESLGPWRLIGLNSNLRGTSMDRQLHWLETELRTAPDGAASPCVLAFWHAPVFSSGRHGHVPYRPTKPNLPLRADTKMQKALQLLHMHGASVVLAGHDHDYEQFKPHDANGKAVKGGIRSFVVGTGGSLLTEDFYTDKWPISEGLYGKAELGNGKQGVLKIDLYERHFEWDFLSIDGTSLPLKTNKGNCNTRKTPLP